MNPPLKRRESDRALEKAFEGQDTPEAWLDEVERATGTQLTPQWRAVFVALLLRLHEFHDVER